jgi:CubicO group peptidase (beta-lactamase class C family)
MISCQSKQEIESDKSTKIDSVVKSFYDNGMFHGIVYVSKNDSIIYNNSYGLANYDYEVPFSNETKVRLASLSKPFTAILILQLVEEGKLNLSDKLSSYYPDLRIEGIKNVTIHHLLTHSSGLSDYDFVTDPFRVYRYDYFKPEHQIDLQSKTKLRFEPGSQFHYCTLGFNLLSGIIEQITSKPFEQVLNEKILVPSGMLNSGVDFTIAKNKASSYINSINGMINSWEESSSNKDYELFSTINDLQKFHKALNSNILLSDTLIDVMLFPYMKIDEKNYYGYGWNVSYLIDSVTNDSTIEYHHGGYSGYSGSLLYRDIKNEISIIFLDNVFYSRYPEIKQAIINILHDKPYDVAKKSIYETVKNEINQKGIDSCLELYKAICENDSAYYTGGWQLDNLKLSFRELGLIEYYIKLQLFQFEKYPIFEKFTKTQIRKMDFILKHEPENGLMYACRGGLFYSMGNFNLAKQDFKLALKKGIPDNEIEYIKSLMLKCEQE